MTAGDEPWEEFWARAQIRKRYWDVVKRKKMPGHPHGECDAPSVKGKQIRIYGEQSGRQLVDTVIHEFLHAAFWDLDDEVVHEVAHDLARLLDRLGLIR